MKVKITEDLLVIFWSKKFPDIPRSELKTLCNRFYSQKQLFDGIDPYGTEATKLGRKYIEQNHGRIV